MPTSFSQENIIYKFLDSNIFALATHNANNDLILYLINGVSGKVINKFIETKVRLDLPIDMILCENNFIVTFQRSSLSGLTQQELTVTELFKQRIEDNTKKLLFDYYRGEERFKTHTYSSFSHETPAVVQETYVLPF